MINFDYTIVAKVLANRVIGILPKLIDSDQTGYMKNRFIGENIRTISDLITLTNLKNMPGLILLVDFEKAFDTVEWSYSNRVLNIFGFEDSFKSWVKILYTDISSCIINDGFTSNFFNIGRGVRQGCPLSPYLLVLCVEILAIATSIRQNKKNKRY